MKHKPYVHRWKQPIKWTESFGCYILEDSDMFYLPCKFFLGERILYLEPSLDYHSAEFRGNLSDDWPCIDFGHDFAKALEWLHQAEEKADRTKQLWTKK